MGQWRLVALPLPLLLPLPFSALSFPIPLPGGCHGPLPQPLGNHPSWKAENLFGLFVACFFVDLEDLREIPFFSCFGVIEIFTF